MESVEILVVGAGVVGLAVARAIGSQTSSRNSEVVHAGLYYPPGIAEGPGVRRRPRTALRLRRAHGVAHRRCGKLIVASRPGQIPQLDAIAEAAGASGVDDLRPLSGPRPRR